MIPGDSADVRGGIRFESTTMVSRGPESSGFARMADQCLGIARACIADIEGTKESKTASNLRKRVIFQDHVSDGGRRVEIA